MAVGKSRRVVIDLDDVDLKRRLHSALAEDGRSLKDWFLRAATDYLEERLAGRQLQFPGLKVAEPPTSYARTPREEHKR
jgi:hypothetical protein